MDTIRIILFSCIWWALTATASSQEAGDPPTLTTEEIVDELFMVRMVTASIVTHRNTHGGSGPQSINDIRNLMDLPPLLEKNRRLGSFPERYALITGPLKYYEGDVVLLGLKPIRKSSTGGRTFEIGRYAGYKARIGESWAALFIPESEVPQLITELGGSAPPAIGSILSPNQPIAQVEDNSEFNQRVREYARQLEAEQKAGPQPKASEESALTKPAAANPLSVPSHKTIPTWAWWGLASVGFLIAATIIIRKRNG